MGDRTHVLGIRRLLAAAGVVVALATAQAAALDGSALAVTVDHKEIRFIDMATGERRTIVRADTFTPNGLLWAPRFSTDGKRISFTRTEAYGVGLGIVVIAHNDGAYPTDIASLHDDWMGTAASWTLDGRLWWSEYGDCIYWVNAATRQSGSAGPFSPKILGAVVSRDGTRAAASCKGVVP